MKTQNPKPTPGGDMEAIFGTVNDHSHQRREAREQGMKEREAAKAANRANILRAKRRSWWRLVLHWTIYYLGLTCGVCLAELLWLPEYMSLILGAVVMVDVVMRMAMLTVNYPKKEA